MRDGATMKTSNTADRTRRTPGESGGTAGESGAFVGTLEKREELQEKLVYTRKRRSFKVTPGKLEELRVSLVEMREKPAKGGETPEKRGEPEMASSIKKFYRCMGDYGKITEGAFSVLCDNLKEIADGMVWEKETAV